MTIIMIRFGPSGNSQSFYDDGFKSSVQMPKWLREKGLDAYEYSCSKGVRIGQEKAIEMGIEAEKNDIMISIHAPYYISMASKDLQKRENSKMYILDTLKAARWMKAKRIVIHVGSCTGMNRQEALNIAIGVLKESIHEADNHGFEDITICPEVLGKINQLGSLEEIIEMCKIDERLIPTVDFAHLHARSMGALNTIDDYIQVIEKIENGLGTYRLKNLHCHFSHVEYTKGGEKRHVNLDDIGFGPDFRPLAEIMVKKNMSPTIICESRENMAEDALKLKEIYMRALRGE